MKKLLLAIIYLITISNTYAQDYTTMDKILFGFIVIIALLSGALIVILGKKYKDRIKSKKEDNSETEELLLEIPIINYNKVIVPSENIFQSRSSLPNEKGNVRLKYNFPNINQLEAGNLLYLTFKNIKYKYVVLDKYLINKEGYMQVDDESECNTLTIINVDNASGENNLIVVFYLVGKEKI